MDFSRILKNNLSEYLEKYGNQSPESHLRAIRDILLCRTPELGGEVYLCQECAELHYSYHSCKNRHCPKCGRNDSAKWLEKQLAKLLPVKYFMVTFTIPRELHKTCLSNQKLLYDLQFKASSEALKTLLSDPKYAGGVSGFTGVLHTWTRQLEYHPHIHYIVPGGAWNKERKEWQKAGNKFLIPVKALSVIYRAKFRDLLRLENQHLFGRISPLVWQQKEFVTDSRPVGKGREALTYLANYVYRTAITNNRILWEKDGLVTFKYKPAGSAKFAFKSVDSVEFINKFLMHVLPQGFQKIRYYGFLSPAAKSVWEMVNSFFPAKSDSNDKNQTAKTFVIPKFEKDLCPNCKSKMTQHASITGKPRSPPWSLLFLANCFDGGKL